jgi:hypothetical protein
MMPKASNCMKVYQKKCEITSKLLGTLLSTHGSIILNEQDKFPNTSRLELYGPDLEAAIATGDGDAVHSVTSRITGDTALSWKTYPYRNHVNALLDHRQGELRLRSLKTAIKGSVEGANARLLTDSGTAPIGLLTGGSFSAFNA